VFVHASNENEKSKCESKRGQKRRGEAKFGHISSLHRASIPKSMGVGTLLCFLLYCRNKVKFLQHKNEGNI